MSVLFSAADQCWVSPECQRSVWKDPHSAQLSVKGSHDVSLTIGWCLLSHSTVSSVCYWCLKNRLHKHPWSQKKEEEISKAILPGAVLLRCDSETAEMLFNSLHDLNSNTTRSLEVKQLVGTRKGHPRLLNLLFISSFRFHQAKQMFCQRINCEAADSSGNVYISLRLSSYLMLNPYSLALK